MTRGRVLDVGQIGSLLATQFIMDEAVLQILGNFITTIMSTLDRSQGDHSIGMAFGLEQ